MNEILFNVQRNLKSSVFRRKWQFYSPVLYADDNMDTVIP